MSITSRLQVSKSLYQALSFAGHNTKASSPGGMGKTARWTAAAHVDSLRINLLRMTVYRGRGAIMRVLERLVSMDPSVRQDSPAV